MTGLVLTAGIIVVLVVLVKAALDTVHIPSLVGFILIGAVLNAVNRSFGLLPSGTREILGFMARIGLAALLFRIGLESNLKGLLKHLKGAAWICCGNIAVSFAVVFSASYCILGLERIPSLFLSVAFIATSVAIPVNIWKETGDLDSPLGETLVDVAELDDIISILLMAVLFAAVPVLKNGENASLASELSAATGVLLLKLVLFGTLCLLFALYAEKHITRFFKRIQPSPEPMLVIAGIGFIMGGLARVLGFSIAVGAFFGGLVFSRDPEAVRMESSFNSLYALLAPFFFIGIGFHADIRAFSGLSIIIVVLFAAAVAGKIAGTALPAFPGKGWKGSLLLGVSMVPRSEIAMVVMSRGLKTGPWAVPPGVYTGAVITAVLTCILIPVFMRMMLGKLQRGC